MQNVDISRLGFRTRVGNIVTTPVSEVYSVYRDRYIRSHTGFGPGDRVTPTAGAAGTAIVNYVQGRQGGIHAPTNSRIVDEGYFSDTYAPDFGGVPDFIDAESYNKALNKLYDKLYQTELNLAVSVGEARQALANVKLLETASEHAISVARRARDLARLKRKWLHNPTQALAETWLSLKYAWLPTVQDIYNVLQHEALRLSSVRVGTRASYGSGTTRTSSSTLPWNIVEDHQQRCEIAVWVEPHDQTAFDVARWTSLNPLSLAWELFPLSFVVDWFYNIGGYLENMERSFGIGLTFKRGYVTRQRKSVQTAVLIRDGVPNLPFPGWTGWQSLQASQTNTHKVRTVLSDFPRPALPRFNISLGSQQIISAAALIRTILLGNVK